MQIARICLQRNIPVDLFVNSAFTDTMCRHSFVTASDICSFDYKKLERKEVESESVSSPQDLWNVLTCKLLDMAFSLDGCKGKNDILDSAMYGFPAWFRVFSSEHPVQRIIVHWGDLAYEEIQDNKKLESYLKERRPRTYKLLKSVIENI